LTSYPISAFPFRVPLTTVFSRYLPEQGFLHLALRRISLHATSLISLGLGLLPGWSEADRLAPIYVIASLARQRPLTSLALTCFLGLMASLSADLLGSLRRAESRHPLSPLSDPDSRQFQLLNVPLLA